MINTTSILAIADSDGVVGEGTFFTSYFLGEPMTPNTWPAGMAEQERSVMMVHQRGGPLSFLHPIVKA